MISSCVSTAKWAHYVVDPQFMWRWDRWREGIPRWGSQSRLPHRLHRTSTGAGTWNNQWCVPGPLSARWLWEAALLSGPIGHGVWGCFLLLPHPLSRLLPSSLQSTSILHIWIGNRKKIQGPKSEWTIIMLWVILSYWNYEDFRIELEKWKFIYISISYTKYYKIVNKTHNINIILIGILPRSDPEIEWYWSGYLISLDSLYFLDMMIYDINN